MTERRPTRRRKARSVLNPEAPELNPRQAQFVDEYITHFNATRAATKAKYSAKTAEQIGYQLLQNPSVQKAIAARIATRREANKATAEEVVERLTMISRANMGQVMDWGVKEIAIGFDATGARVVSLDDAKMVYYGEEAFALPVNKRDIPPEALEAVSEVSLSRTGGLKIKLGHKLAALDKLARHLGVFKEDAAQLQVAVSFIVERTERSPPLRRVNEG